MDKDHWLLYIPNGKDKHGKDQYIVMFFETHKEMLEYINQNNYPKYTTTRIPITSWDDPEFIERYRKYHGNCCDSSV